MIIHNNILAHPATIVARQRMPWSPRGSAPHRLYPVLLRWQVHVFNLETSFKMQTHILATRSVRPDSAGHWKITADVVEKRVVQVVKRFELCDSHITAVVTDGGTNVKGEEGQAFKLE